MKKTNTNLIDTIHETCTWVEHWPVPRGGPDHREAVRALLNQLKEDISLETYADRPCRSLLPRREDVPAPMLEYVDRKLRSAFDEAADNSTRWAIFAASLHLQHCFSEEARAQTKAINLLRSLGWTVRRVET